MTAGRSTAWVEALDTFAAELARQRSLLEELAADPESDRTVPALAYAFPDHLGPLPPDLATYARAVLADSLVLEEHMMRVSGSIAEDLGSTRAATRRYRPTARTGGLDRSL